MQQVFATAAPSASADERTFLQHEPTLLGPRILGWKSERMVGMGAADELEERYMAKFASLVAGRGVIIN